MAGMELNLLNLIGGMVGVDLHVWNFPAPSPTGLPGVNLFYTIGVHPIGSFWRWSYTIKFHHVPTLQAGFTMEPVRHIPLPLPPGPLAPAIISLTNWLGTSQPMFAIDKVRGEGTPLLAEPFGLFGMNSNCGFMPFTWTNVDINPISIHKSADPEDYAKWLIGMAVEGVYNSIAAAAGFIPGAGGTAAGVLIAAWQNVWDGLGRAFSNTLPEGDPMSKFTLKLDDLTNYVINKNAGLPTE